MTGETDLAVMLANMEPCLDSRRFVFVSFPGMSIAEAARYSPVGVFQEREGLTVITEPTAIPDMEDAPRFAMISLSVHSSLEAVGLTAAFARVLADRGISANVVAGAMHDHIFVPEASAEAAMDALRSLGG